MLAVASSVGGAGTGAAGAGVTGSGTFDAGVCPPPVGTLSTYSLGAEVGSGLSGTVGSVGAGVVSVGVVSVGVVSVGVVWVGSVAVWPWAGTATPTLSAAATTTAHAECFIERNPFEPRIDRPSRPPTYHVLDNTVEGVRQACGALQGALRATL